MAIFADRCASWPRTMLRPVFHQMRTKITLRVAAWFRNPARSMCGAVTAVTSWPRAVKKRSCNLNLLGPLSMLSRYECALTRPLYFKGFVSPLFLLSISQQSPCWEITVKYTQNMVFQMGWSVMRGVFTAANPVHGTGNYWSGMNGSLSKDWLLNRGPSMTKHL